jgi:hypothetical protein
MGRFFLAHESIRGVTIVELLRHLRNPNSVGRDAPENRSFFTNIVFFSGAELQGFHSGSPWRFLDVEK